MFKTDKRTVTDFDAQRLQMLIAAAHHPESGLYAWLEKLRSLLQEAERVRSEEIDPDCVTMNSRIRLQDTGSLETLVLTVVFPATAMKNPGKGFEQSDVSILSPIGLSVLGRRAGDTICGRIRIADVLYQPEASGHYNL